MIKMNIPATTRISIVKNILSIFLISTLAFTWPLWSAGRYYPLFPQLEALNSVHIVIAYAVPALLILVLALVFLLRKPRTVIFFSVLLCLALLLLDSGRLQYWFYFYVLMFLILLGYNWRVDKIQHYSGYLNAVKIILALVYLVAAIQHFQSGFVHTQWPAFIKPFERFWTPEQCAYLLKIAYAIPFLELFVAIGLFIPGPKIAAMVFSILFHLFSVAVLLMQLGTEMAVVLWHLCMSALVIFVFGGSLAGQKDHGFSLGLYPAFAVLLFALVLPTYFYLTDKPMMNKLDMMQVNTLNQYIYLDQEEKEKLPLYVQSFALQRENGYCKLSVSSWAYHEIKTRPVLSAEHLMRLSEELNKNYGADALVAIPANDHNKTIALK